MRSQRRAAQTVVHVAVSRTDPNGTGDFTAAEVSTEIEGAIFQPRQLVQHTGDDAAPVFAPAVWDLPGVHQVGNDDRIEFAGCSWYVIGGGTVWLDRTRVPVSATRPS